MSILINAFPIVVPETAVKACVTPFDGERFDKMREEHQATHAVRRKGKDLLIFSYDGTYPIDGEVREIILKDNYWLFCFLVKDALKKHLSNIGRLSVGFNPIQIISTRPEDDLLIKIVDKTFPFKICLKYSVDVRIINSVPSLVIDCSTRQTTEKTCSFFCNRK